MSNPAIEIKNLSKVYRINHERSGMKGTATLRDSLVEFAHKPIELFTGRQLKKEEFWALKDINLELEQGDVVGIIGKNGSGKSTLLKVLSQIVDPTRGEIRMRGRVASLLEVGTGFHPELTGRENIFFNGAILGMKRKEIISKFDEIVAFSEVEQFLDTPVKYYSSGMYVRLAFAVAAHLDPDILIVDEVLAVGDAAFQKKSIGKMSSVAKSGRTVLFVSHSMPSVKQLCNKGVHLVNGQIAKAGTIDEAVDSYLNSHLKVQSEFSLDKPMSMEDLAGYIKKISIFDRHGKPATTVDFAQDFQLEVDFITTKDLDDFVIGVGVKNGLEVGVRTVWSRPQPIAKGHYKARFLFDQIILEAGIYSFEIGLSNNGRSFFTSDGDAFTSIEATADHDPRIVQISGSGIVLNPINIDIREV